MLLKVVAAFAVLAAGSAFPLTYVTPTGGQQHQQLAAGPALASYHVPAQSNYQTPQTQSPSYQEQPSPAAYNAQSSPIAYRSQQSNLPSYQPQPSLPQSYQTQTQGEGGPQYVLGAGQGAPAKTGQQLLPASPEDFDSNPQYQFSFDVKDDQFTNYQNRKEQRKGDKISGSYSVVDSDGFIRTVKYTADPLEGFKAEVTREPTDIVVKFPTPPPTLPKNPQAQYTQEARQQAVHQYLQGTQQELSPAQVYSSLAHQSPQQLGESRPAPGAVQLPNLQKQYSLQTSDPQGYIAQAPSANPVKAGAIGYATQPTGGSIVYQAYQQ